MKEERLKELERISAHRETYNPNANEPQVLDALRETSVALKEALREIHKHEREARRKWTLAAISQWTRETFGVPDAFLVAARINEEMAELLIQIAKAESDSSVNYGEAMDKAAVEIADVVIVCCHLASAMNIDLTDMIEQKMTINAARKWNVSGGVGYHVKGAG
jgi:NTP pyrophosphatase (non-canonical NTP hydrolase)